MDTKTVYELKADGVRIWTGPKAPKQRDIDKAALKADGNGWNGLEIELYHHGVLKKSVYPTDGIFG